MKKNYISKNKIVIGIQAAIVIGILLSTTLLVTAGTVPSLPSSIKKGDLLLMDLKGSKPGDDWYVPGWYNEHCAIYYGYENGHHVFIQSPSTSDSLVGKDTWETIYNGHAHFKLLEVEGSGVTQTTRNNAAEWAWSKEDDEFQAATSIRYKICNWNTDNPLGGHDSTYYYTRNMWTCSELVWAAYYAQGVDIDWNGWTCRSYFPFYEHGPYVFPQEILNDGNTDGYWTHL